MNSKLFTPHQIGNLKIKNRVVRSATYLASASDKGEVTDRIISVHENLAKNQIGLIITGYMYIKDGKCSPGQLGIHDNSLIPGLKRLVSVVKEYNDVILIPQIVHGGRQMYISKDTTVFAPSPIPDRFLNVMPKEMSHNDIKNCVQNFIDATQRAYEAGFDGVQLHVAHGYLLSEFISPYCNRRTDSYGGSCENRFRIIKEIILGIQDSLGKEFPITAKLNIADFVRDEPQLTIEESKIFAKMIADLGVVAIETSAGLIETDLYGDNTACRRHIDTREDEAYFLKETKIIKNKIGDVPVILTGGIKSPEVAEKVLQEGIDFIGLCRPLIREPDLITKWASKLNKRSDCVSCNRCLLFFDKKRGIRCMQLEKLERKKKKKIKKVEK